MTLPSVYLVPMVLSNGDNEAPSKSFPEVTVRRARLWSFGVLALGTVLAQVGGGPTSQLSEQTSALRDEILATMGRTRLVEGRLAGFEYAPYGGARPQIESRQAGLKLRELAGNCGKPILTRYDLDACALLNIADGRIALAVRLLEEAAAAPQAPSYVFTDLAAAYIEQARTGESPDRLTFAVSAVKRASAAREDALFNSLWHLKSSP